MLGSIYLFISLLATQSTLSMLRHIVQGHQGGGILQNHVTMIYQPLHQGVASLSGARCVGSVALISHLGVFHTAQDFQHS